MDIQLFDEQDYTERVEPQGEMPTILFVDNEPRFLKMIERKYADSGWNLLFADCGDDGLNMLARHDVDLVVSDMKMPEMSGPEFLAAVGAKYPEITCLLMTGFADLASTIDAINQGHVYGYIAKSCNDFEFKMAVYKGLQHKKQEDETRELHKIAEAQSNALQQYRDVLEESVRSKTDELKQATVTLRRSRRELENSHRACVKIFSQFIELRGDRSGHGRRVAQLAERLVQEFSSNEQFRQQVSVAARLHEIGKIWLSDREWNHRCENLTDEEKLRCRQHPVIGAELITGLTPYAEAAALVRSHRELFDGSGYPDGLSGFDIPLGSRVLAIVSDFDDLVHGVLDGSPMSPAEAYSYLEAHTGTRYDPQIVRKFALVLREMETAAGADPELLSALL